jgi:tight adherence protein C
MNQYDLIPIALFAVVSCGTYLIMRVASGRYYRIQSRVDELLAVEGTGNWQPAGNSKFAAKLTSGIVGLLHHTKLEDVTNPVGLQRRLVKAGIYSPAATSWFFVAKLVLMLTPPVAIIAANTLGFPVMKNFSLFGLAAGGIGALAPGLWLDRKISARHASLRRSLPDFLDLMNVCLEAGLSLQETIRRVNEELQLAHPILAYELDIVQRDIDLSCSIDQALKKFAVRTDCEGIRTLSTFIRESQRFGTQITDALRNHADMLRSQREQLAEENAQKAAVKILLPTLLLIFPAIFVVLVGPAVIQIQEAFAAK